MRLEPADGLVGVDETRCRQRHVNYSQRAPGCSTGGTGQKRRPDWPHWASRAFNREKLVCSRNGLPGRHTPTTFLRFTVHPCVCRAGLCQRSCWRSWTYKPRAHHVPNTIDSAYVAATPPKCLFSRGEKPRIFPPSCARILGSDAKITPHFLSSPPPRAAAVGGERVG